MSGITRRHAPTAGVGRGVAALAVGDSSTLQTHRSGWLVIRCEFFVLNIILLGVLSHF